MNKVNFSFWNNEIDKAMMEIYRVKKQIQSVGKKLKTNNITYDDFELIFDNVSQTLNYWTGHTYIGQEKGKFIKKVFQAFFEELYNFLFICRELDNSELQKIADKALYRGILYRYLGHGLIEGNISNRVEPQYNDIYVSWSKQPQNSYIESKLYGTMTLLTCRIDEPYYGIDLEVFGAVRGNEAEVVFPTIRETIKDIKYIEE